MRTILLLQIYVLFHGPGFFDPAEGASGICFDNGNEIECITFEDESSMIPSDEIYFKDTENYFITDNGDIIIVEPGDIQTYAGLFSYLCKR